MLGHEWMGTPPRSAAVQSKNAEALRDWAGGDQFWRAYGEYNRFTVLDAIKSSKQKALSAKTIILSDSQGHAITIQIGIRYTRRLLNLKV